MQPYSPNHGIKFDYKASSTSVVYEVQLTTEEVGGDYGYYACTFTAANTGWNTMTVYFPGQGVPALAQPSYAAPVAWDPAKVGAVIFQPLSQATAFSYGLCIDNVTFAVAPAPTATCTPSPSFTRSPTPTASPSITPSPSPSSTITLSPTDSETANGTFTVTPTPSVTPSTTATPTVSPSFSVSPSYSETLVVSPTSTITASATPSATPSASPSSSVSPTLTATLTWTPTQLSTATFTRTRTPTLSGSPVPLKILNAVVAPDPVLGPHIGIAVDLAASASSFELKLYSRSLTLVDSLKVSGSYNSGWNLVSFDLPAPLASGLYFGRLLAVDSRGLRVGDTKTLKLFLMP